MLADTSSRTCPARYLMHCYRQWLPDGPCACSGIMLIKKTFEMKAEEYLSLLFIRAENIYIHNIKYFT